MVGSEKEYSRVVIDLVRDGTRLRIRIGAEIGKEEAGCFVVVRDYVAQVIEGKRQSCYGVWLTDRNRP